MAYLANDKYNAVLSQGYTTGDTTLYVNAVPTHVPTIVVLGKGTVNETIFSVTNKTSNSLTGIARLRGANVNLDVNTAVTCLNNEEFINQFENALFAAEGLKELIYGADGGSTDAYAISLNPAPTAYANLTGVPITFKANTANTGAATLNINSVGATAIKKNHDQDLETGDIEANQIVMVAYDGTYFEMTSQPATVISPTSTTTFTNKRITKRVTSTASSSTPTPNVDTTDIYHLTALAAGATFGAPTGTPAEGDKLEIRIKDNGTARSLAFNSGAGGYRFSTDLPAPTTTVLSKTMYLGFVWNGADSKWDYVGGVNNFT